MTPTARIHKLTIQRFRGIHALKWLPAQGMNIILGGGDVGKTTLLESIALLLSPSNTAVNGWFSRFIKVLRAETK